MFKNSYQSGSSFPLFNVTDKKSHDNWYFTSNIKKAYDKSLKGYAIILKHNSKLCAPSNRNLNLYLIQPFLVFQILVLDKRYFSLEIAVTDMEGTKRRLYFHNGTQVHECAAVTVQPLHAKIEHDLVVEGEWLNLQIDVQSFVEPCFKQANFRSIDNITVCGDCRLRRVFTTKHQLPESLEQPVVDASLYTEHLPQGLDFHPDIASFN